MTDEPSARDEAVRRLLAEARHDAPMPDDVAARLDGVLADLAGEPTRVRPVTDLATRRRRVARILVAAAAVVAVGTGLQQIVGPQSADESASPTADSEAGADRLQLDDEGEGEEAAESEAGAALSTVPQTGANRELPRLRVDEFAADVDELRGGAQALEGAQTYDGSARTGGAYEASGKACGVDDWGQGTFVPVRYDRAPAVLAFRETRGDTQVADLFVCGSTEPVRSVTLPAP